MVPGAEQERCRSGTKMGLIHWACAKVCNKLRCLIRDTNMQNELTMVDDALGINRAMVYHGVNEPDTFEPVGIAVKRIPDCIDERRIQV